MSLRHLDNGDWYTGGQLTRRYESLSVGSGAVQVGPYGRSSGPAVRFLGDAAAYMGRRLVSGVSGAKAVQQADFAITAYPASTTAVLRIYDGSTVQATLALHTDGTLQVYRGNLTTALGSPSSYVVPLNQFIVLGWELTISDAAGIALVHVWAPGDVVPQVVLNLTSQDTKATGNATWDGFDFHAACADMTTWTNMVVADGSGGVNTALWGPGDVVTCLPIAAGTHSEFVPSTGIVNYVMVDDPTADDLVTSLQPASVNDLDTYRFATIPDLTRTLYGCMLMCVAIGQAGTEQLAAVGRQSGTDLVGASVTLGTSWAARGVPYDKAPNTAAWTLAIFHALEWGLKRVA